MLEQSFRRSSAQNRGLGGDVTLKSGEPAAVPTAAAAVGVQKTAEKSAAEPRYMTFEAQNFLLNKDACLLFRKPCAAISYASGDQSRLDILMRFFTVMCWTYLV